MPSAQSRSTHFGDAKVVSIRKLVALDMVLHGTRFILAEFAFGILFPLILVLISIRGGLFSPVRIDWETALDFWLLGIAMNYVPLLIYAVLISKGQTEKKEGESELVYVKRYSIQQVIVFVPLLVLTAALIQEIRPQTRR